MYIHVRQITTIKAEVTTNVHGLANGGATISSTVSLSCEVKFW